MNRSGKLHRFGFELLGLVAATLLAACAGPPEDAMPTSMPVLSPAEGLAIYLPLVLVSPSPPSLVYARDDRSLWLWQPGLLSRQLTRSWPVDNPMHHTGFLTWEISPDGRHLAYFHALAPVQTPEPPLAGVHLVSLANGPEQTLVWEALAAAHLDTPLLLGVSPGVLAWSPDSQWLAFVAYHEVPEGAVYVASLADPSPHRLTDGPAEQLAWSPDGRYLAFVGREVSPEAIPRRLAWVPADGSAPARTLDASLVSGYGWSSDGHLAVHFYAPEASGVEGLPPTTRLALVNPEDSTLTVLFEGYALTADWSPTRDAFAVQMYDPVGPTRNGLYLINLDGRMEALVTDPTAFDDTPATLYWSPTGRHIAWMGSCCACQVHVMTLATWRIQDWLTTCQTTGLHWSPDGRYLFVSGGEPAGLPFSLPFVVFDVEGGAIVAQGVGPAQREGTEAAWSPSPDGHYVASIQPELYLGKGTGVAVGALVVGEMGRPAYLVDSRAATWGPGVTWVQLEDGR